MNKLLSVDLYRLRKDKTPLLGVIIGAGLFLMTTGLYVILYFLSKDADSTPFTTMLNSRVSFISSFQMGNNVGLVVVIILAVFTSRDFTQNTLRLKVINNLDRRKIYISTLLTNLIYGLVVIVTFALLTLVVMTLLFGYGSAFDVNEFFHLLGTTSIALLFVILYISIITAVSMKFQTIGASIGLSIAVIIGESIIVTILRSMPAAMPNFPEWLYKGFNVFPSSGMSSLLTTFDGVDAMIMVIASIVLIVGINILGLQSFKKSDIK